MHTSHTYHCHEHDAHKEHTHGRIFFKSFLTNMICLLFAVRDT